MPMILGSNMEVVLFTCNAKIVIPCDDVRRDFEHFCFKQNVCGQRLNSCDSLVRTVTLELPKETSTVLPLSYRKSFTDHCLTFLMASALKASSSASWTVCCEFLQKHFNVHSHYAEVELLYVDLLLIATYSVVVIHTTGSRSCKCTCFLTVAFKCSSKKKSTLLSLYF